MPLGGGAAIVVFVAELLKKLKEYFPTSVFTGDSLVFISEDSRVELTEHARGGFGDSEAVPVIRVGFATRMAGGQFEPNHYEDFKLERIGELAAEIEKFIQFAVGKTIRESNM